MSDSPAPRGPCQAFEGLPEAALKGQIKISRAWPSLKVPVCGVHLVDLLLTKYTQLCVSRWFISIIQAGASLREF